MGELGLGRFPVPAIIGRGFLLMVRPVVKRQARRAEQLAANLTVLSVLITDVSAAITASVRGVAAAGIAFCVLYMRNRDDFTMHESLRNQRRPVIPGRANSGIERHWLVLLA